MAPPLTLTMSSLMPRSFVEARPTAANASLISTRSRSAGVMPSFSQAWAIARVENDSHREVLEMTYLQKLAADEIADRLGISLDNVYARRSRGVKRLEEMLRDPGP